LGTESHEKSQFLPKNINIHSKKCQFQRGKTADIFAEWTATSNGVFHPFYEKSSPS
jgi:hypothetical protein